MSRRAGRSGAPSARRRPGCPTRRGRRCWRGRSHPTATRAFASARALARALEEVTLRQPGLEDRHPYPGLAAFTERDAEYFFGRELEVEAVWKKLKRPRMLGLIGPSGAGKSSFLRAGLLPTLPSTWRAVLATPGTRPFQALAEALVPEFAGDTEALQSLVRFDDLDTAVAVVGALAEGPRAHPRHRRSVRRTVHAESDGDSGSVRAAPLTIRSRCRPSRRAVDARRLPGPLPRARRTVSDPERSHAARPSRSGRAAAGAGAAGARLRVSVRGRVARRRHGSGGRTAKKVRCRSWRSRRPACGTTATGNADC